VRDTGNEGRQAQGRPPLHGLDGPFPGTVHFPEHVVAFAEQRNFRLAGPDGTIFLFGNNVTACRRANFEAGEARRQAEERRATGL
jgi:hypothetical protein